MILDTTLYDVNDLRSSETTMQRTCSGFDLKTDTRVSAAAAAAGHTRLSTDRATRLLVVHYRHDFVLSAFGGSAHALSVNEAV
jgi:hypothetical protein